MTVLACWLAAAVAAAPAPLQTVPPDALKQAALGSLALPAGSSIALAAPLPDLRLPAGELRLEAQPTVIRGNRVGVPLTAWVDGRPQRRILVRFTVRQMAPGLVYAEDQRAHAPASALRLVPASVDRRAHADVVAADFQPPPGARLRRMVRAQDTVRSSDFVATPEVVRGAPVRLVAVSGAIRVTLSGVAVTDAARGQTAQVRIGGRVLSGRVSDRGEVRTDG